MQADQMNITPQEMTEEAIEAELASIGIHPSAMTPADKFKIIQRLYEGGIFLMRGSVFRAAQALELSEPSIYRYLTAVRAKARNGTA
jgi:predicted transcriptional regulator YheO